MIDRTLPIERDPCRGRSLEPDDAPDDRDYQIDDRDDHPIMRITDAYEITRGLCDCDPSWDKPCKHVR